MNATLPRILFPSTFFSAVLAGGTLAGRPVDGVLSVLLPTGVVVLALAVLVAVLLTRGGRTAQLGSSDEHGGPVETGTAMVWEVDAPDGHVVYRGTDVELASELYHLEPPGAHLHLSARPTMSGGQ